MTRSESQLLYFNLTDMFTQYKQCMDLDQGYWIQFYRILYLKIKGVDLILKGKGDLLVLAPKWCLVWEGRSVLYKLSYWIQVCSKVLKYDSRSEFYELNYWIQVYTQVW
jgi:hypothetical protein